MFKFKKKNVLPIQEYKDIIRIQQCNATNGNDGEYSIVSEIHKLQDQKKLLSEELDNLNCEVSNFNISIPHYVASRLYYDTDQFCYMDEVNLKLLKNSLSGDLYSFGTKLIELSKLQQRPDEIKNNIAKIDTKIKELKREINIE